MILFYLFACQSSQLSDEWWQNEESNPYTLGSYEGEGDEGGEDEESGFFGLLQESDNGYIGENGVEMPGCIWYVDITAQEASACPDCSFGVMIQYEEFHILENELCPDGYIPEEYANTNPIKLATLSFVFHYFVKC